MSRIRNKSQESEANASQGRTRITHTPAQQQAFPKHFVTFTLTTFKVVRVKVVLFFGCFFETKNVRKFREIVIFKKRPKIILKVGKLKK